MTKAKQRIGYERGAEKPQEVMPIRRTLADADELFLVRGGRIILPERGDIPLLKILDQAYDEPNVIALELTLGDKEQVDIRKLDRALERKLQRALRGKERGTGPIRTYLVRMRLVVVVG